MAIIHKVNQEMYARIINLLMQKPVTAHELSDKVGIHVVNAQGLMRCFKRHNVVHIYSWRTDRLGRDCTPVYVMGDGLDKPRRKMTATERQRKYRIKKELEK